MSGKAPETEGNAPSVQTVRRRLKLTTVVTCLLAAVALSRGAGLAEVCCGLLMYGMVLLPVILLAGEQPPSQTQAPEQPPTSFCPECLQLTVGDRDLFQEVTTTYPWEERSTDDEGGTAAPEEPQWYCGECLRVRESAVPIKAAHVLGVIGEGALEQASALLGTRVHDSRWGRLTVTSDGSVCVLDLATLQLPEEHVRERHPFPALETLWREVDTDPLAIGRALDRTERLLRKGRNSSSLELLRRVTVFLPGDGVPMTLRSRVQRLLGPLRFGVDLRRALQHAQKQKNGEPRLRHAPLAERFQDATLHQRILCNRGAAASASPGEEAVHSRR